MEMENWTQGQNWEAIMFAAHKKINLIATIDVNGQQIDNGTTEQVMALQSLSAKFKAFNWTVLEMGRVTKWNQF